MNDPKTQIDGLARQRANVAADYRSRTDDRGGGSERVHRLTDREYAAFLWERERHARCPICGVGLFPPETRGYAGVGNQRMPYMEQLCAKGHTITLLMDLAQPDEEDECDD